MLIREALFNDQETAALLLVRLGPQRAWSDHLADQRRGKASFNGLRLTPYGQCYVRGQLRPFYRKCDLQNFVNDAKRLGYGPRPLKVTITGTEFQIDNSAPIRHWRSVRLTPYSAKPSALSALPVSSTSVASKTSSTAATIASVTAAT